MQVSDAKLLGLDRLGMDAEVERQGQHFKCRITFPRPAADRKAIKDLVVEMTKAARSGAQLAQGASSQ